MDKKNIYFYLVEQSKECGQLFSSPKPFPSEFDDNLKDWENENNIKLPHSKFNTLITDIYYDLNITGSKWDLIFSQLKSNIDNSNQLIGCIKTLNPFLINESLENLKILIDYEFDEQERKDFFQTLLPSIFQLASKLPQLIKRQIPILKQKTNATLHFTQLQVGCLLANAFLCMFPERKLPQFSLLPDINFTELFLRSCEKNNLKIQKLKSILHYFKRITSHTPTGVISYERRFIENNFLPNWSTSTKKIKDVKVYSNTTIESKGRAHLQVDFANKFIGGGVLGTGCLQEEIRFVICPELILSRLFTEKLNDNEVLVITGIEQFSTYEGYAESFKWSGNYSDDRQFDTFKRRKTKVVAMDALNYYTDKYKQYENWALNRELNKAFCAFVEYDLPNDDKNVELNSIYSIKSNSISSIVTGNWGCGAFRGDIYFKFVIQLLAASETDRNLIYITFKDESFRDEIIKFHNYIVLNDYSVEYLYKKLKNYRNFLNNSKGNFFQYVYKYSAL